MLFPSKSLFLRKGIVEISDCVLERTLSGDPEGMAAWNAAFSGFVISRVEHLHHLAVFQYIGYHEQFDEVPEGNLIPTYGWEMKMTAEDAGTISFHRKFVRKP